MQKRSDYIEDLRSYFPSEDLPSTITTPKFMLFRPNNYRRQIEVKEKTEYCIKKIVSTIQNVNVSPHTKKLSIKNYMKNITISFGKNKVTAIWSQDKIGKHKITHKIERNTIKQIDQRINQISANIQTKLDYSLDHFIKRFKLKIPLKFALWERHENWIKGEDFIDSIPRETIIHDTVFKKVYPEGIEFIGGKNKEPTAFIKNYIKNRAIEDMAPSIANQIRDFNFTTAKLLADFSANIKLHIAVEEKKFEYFKKLIKRLDQKNLKDFF